MSTYTALLFVHVLAAAAWFGAALFSLLLLRRAMQASDRAWVLELMRHDDWMAPVLYVPASFVTLASGVALMATTGFSFADDHWASAGLAIFVAVFALGVAVFMPASKRLAAAVERHGAESDEVGVELRRVRRFSHLDVGLLGIAILLMTVKPG